MIGNKVILIGRTGQDPEIIRTDKTTIAKFSLATTDNYGDKEETDWHNIVCFGRLAEIVEQYVTKGKQIYVEGKLKYNKWEDKEGNRRTSTQIVVNNLQMLDSKKIKLC